jgi:hypothetical protein
VNRAKSMPAQRLKRQVEPAAAAGKAEILVFSVTEWRSCRRRVAKVINARFRSSMMPPGLYEPKMLVREPAQAQGSAANVPFI